MILRCRVRPPPSLTELHLKNITGSTKLYPIKRIGAQLLPTLRRPTNWRYSLLELGRADDTEPVLQAVLKTFEVLYGRDAEVLGGLDSGCSLDAIFTALTPVPRGRDWPRPQPDGPDSSATTYLA